MKKTDHLPVYGVGPLCVYSMAAFLIVGIVLRYLGILESGAVPKLRIPMLLLGLVLVALGLWIWVRAVLIQKVGDAILENHLMTSGVYGWVRNPIYSAAAMAMFGVGLCFANLWFLLLGPIFWLDMTVLMKLTEEKWLLGLYGDEYRDYCRRVNRCIPWFPKR